MKHTQNARARVVHLHALTVQQRGFGSEPARGRMEMCFAVGQNESESQKLTQRTFKVMSADE